MGKREIDIALLELATTATSPEIYQYTTSWGMPVVYYTFDKQKMIDEFIYEPIYFTADYICDLGQSPDELFQNALENTVGVMHSEIMPFSQYVKEFISAEIDSTRQYLIGQMVDALERLDDKEKLWCVTSSIRQHGASGSFYKPLLRMFCDTFHCPRLLIGFNNNDYAFLMQEYEHAKEAMLNLVHQTDHVIADRVNIVKRSILIYDYESDTLRNCKEDR